MAIHRIIQPIRPTKENQMFQILVLKLTEATKANP